MDEFKRIGLYGVSSTGKTTIAESIEKSFNNFECIDGSVILDKVCPGGLENFKRIDRDSQNKYREAAITYITEYQRKEKKNIIITGHYSFLKKDGTIENVWTKADDYFYTDIIYIKDKASDVYDRCILRDKICIDVESIKKWEEHERNAIFNLKKQEIYTIDDGNILERKERAKELINQILLSKEIKSIAKNSKKKIAILLDADGTLVQHDSLLTMSNVLKNIDTKVVKQIFKKYDDYCFSAFYEVAKYYSKNNTYDDFVKASETAASMVEIRKEFIDLIKQVNAEFIVVTAGFSILWKLIVEKHNLKGVKVIGGNTLYDEYLIGQQEKGYVVDVLKKYNKTVVCFGDGLVDKNMFQKSDIGYLIVNEKIKSITPFVQNMDKFQYVSFNGIEIENMKTTNFANIKTKLTQITND